MIIITVNNLQSGAAMQTCQLTFHCSLVEQSNLGLYWLVSESGWPLSLS